MDEPIWMLKGTGRTPDGTKLVATMRFMKKFLDDFGDKEFARMVAPQIVDSMKRKGGSDITLTRLTIAEVQRVPITVTAEDIASGEFTGFAVGDTYHDELVLESRNIPFEGETI